jgi:cation diffusion facilitator family transporter
MAIAIRGGLLTATLLSLSLVAALCVTLEKRGVDGVTAHQPHDHKFGQDEPKAGEQRTIIVITITGLMMVVEIISGIAFGSMALLADGLHMGSHTAALGLAVFAYVYARRHADDERFSFGTGKVNALAGFTGAILLVGFAVAMASESIDRFLHPVTISFNHAIVVAVVGLLVNGVSMIVLGGHHHGNHGHSHSHDHSHHHEDHNLRSAYLHVLADALTSLLAIFALLAGKYAGAMWLDPAMGIVGAVLVIRWSVGLLKQSARVLLDRQAPDNNLRTIVEVVEAQRDTTVSDLHVWCIGPGYYAAEIAIVAGEPESPEYYKGLLPDDLCLAHVTVEVTRRHG